MGPFYCGKILFKEIPPLSKDPIFFQQTKRPELEGGQHSPKKEGSGGNSSGISRILLKNISCPKKEWKNEAHNRSFHSKLICSNTKLQNGNSEINSPQQLGIFIGSDGRLFACPDTSIISQISPFCSKGQNISSNSELYHLSVKELLYSLIS